MLGKRSSRSDGCDAAVAGTAQRPRPSRAPAGQPQLEGRVVDAVLAEIPVRPDPVTSCVTCDERRGAPDQGAELGRPNLRQLRVLRGVVEEDELVEEHRPSAGIEDRPAEDCIHARQHGDGRVGVTRVAGADRGREIRRHEWSAWKTELSGMVVVAERVSARSQHHSFTVDPGFE